MAKQHQLLIGGIGDDAHSIGIGLLALGFAEAGFNVCNLGIRNQLTDFFRHAAHFDVIMISNKNGHAELYLHDFPRLLGEFRLGCDQPKLWYLGGSLSVSESDFLVKKKFLAMGFTNVYPRPRDFWDILQDVKADLVRHNIPRRSGAAGALPAGAPRLDCTQLSDKPYPLEALQAARKQVLQEWVTGGEVRTDHFEKPRHSLDRLLWNRKTAGSSVLLQPRTGVADIEAQIRKLQCLQANGSGVASVQLDAASR
ncbi:MAG: hypothetical protein ICV83_06715, partial [Cytophagales bacterium]|nr:hypothetical protein [Cytophagales bacterium]